MNDWSRLATRLSFATGPFIDGDYRGARGSGSFRTHCPFTESDLASIAICGRRDIDAAATAARAAFRGGWRTLAPGRRRARLVALAQAVQSRRDELALLDCVEIGMPIALARAQIDSAVDFILYYAGLVEMPRGEAVATDPDHALALSWDEPRGVIGIVTAWNYPLLITVSAVAPAIAAGNCVVVKPSEWAPSSSLKLAEIGAACGLPPGVINVVTGDGSTGAQLAKHDGIDQIQFTGSTATARRIMIDAGRSNGKPVIVEAGGRSPQIVFGDAVELDGLGELLVRSAFANTGQICVARTRLLVQQDIRDRVLEMIHAETPKVFRTGNPLDETVNFGPLANPPQAERVRSYVEIGVAEGAGLKALSTAGDRPNRGYFVQPGVFTAASAKMRVAREEIFGPLVTMTSFKTEEEAISLANDSRFGLAATAWTQDLGRARRLSRDLDAGRVDIRASGADGTPLHALPAEPFRDSGFGVLGGREGMRAYQRRKAVQIITG